MSQHMIDRQQVLDLIDAKVKAYQWAKDHAGTDADRRKYHEGLEALWALEMEVKGLHRPEPTPTPTPRWKFTRLAPGEYLAEHFEGERRYWISREGGEQPWVISARFGPGSMVVSRHFTLADAKASI